MHQELVEVENILKLLQRVKKILDLQEKKDSMFMEELINGVSVVNTAVYGCPEYEDISLRRCADDFSLFSGQFERWENMLFAELEYRKSLPNKIDYDFQVLCAHVSAMSEAALIEESLSCLRKIRQESEQQYQWIHEAYMRYHYLWGALDLDHDNIELIKNRIHEIKSHWEDFYWLYHNLADYRSKKVLYGIIHYWLTFDLSYKNTIIENNYDDYFDLDIISCEEEVFVDLGAFIGDSALSFIDNFGTYKRIYCYEMTELSMQVMKQKLAGFDRIEYRQAAVGNVTDTVCVAEFEDISSNIIRKPGDNDIATVHKENRVPMVRLDDDICEPITFLKMDIEGCELEALKGAEQHIRKDKPKLAVCSYHNNHHIYEIPKLMREYNPQYKLYMRYNGALDNAQTSEFVTFAIP